MSNNEFKESTSYMTYQIRLKGHLQDSWNDWFNGQTITREENGDTCISCQVADQPALFGLLRKVRDLGLPLISVIQVESEVESESFVQN